MKEIKRGHIYFADLNPTKGHERGGYRPVLVLQKDPLNKYLNTVIVAPITKNLKAKGYLTTYFLPKKNSKLAFDSVLFLFQIRTIDKRRLKRFVSHLDTEQLLFIREQLQLVI